MKTVRVMLPIKFVYLIGISLLVSPAFAQTANSDCWSDPPTMISNKLSIEMGHSFSIGCIFPLEGKYPYASLDCILEHRNYDYLYPNCIESAVCTTSNGKKLQNVTLLPKLFSIFFEITRTIY